MRIKPDKVQLKLFEQEIRLVQLAEETGIDSTYLYKMLNRKYKYPKLTPEHRKNIEAGLTKLLGEPVELEIDNVAA